MFSLHATVATRTGVRRTENQDRTLVAERRVAVADGMGGHHDGDLAAQIAIASLAEMGLASTANDLVNGFWSANTRILDHALDDPRRPTMGSTLVALEVLGAAEAIAIASIGDSRAYRLRDGELWRITSDHTWETTLRDAGVEPVDHHGRHVLTRCLGSTTAIEVDAWTLDLRPDDRFLLCSDGIGGVLGDSTIGALLAGADDGRTARRVVSTAIDAHSTDDVTALVADVVPAHDPATRLRRMASADRHPSRRTARVPGTLTAPGHPLAG